MALPTPKPLAAMVGPSGYPTTEWYNYLKQTFEAAAGNAALQAQIDALVQQIADLDIDFSISGPQSVRVLGNPSDGLVRLNLDGDQTTPSATHYYGTDADAARGFHALLIAALGDVDLTGLADEDVLAWDATAEKWVPVTGGGIAGPVSSTDNALVRWDGTGGNALQDSGVLLTDNAEISAYRGHLNLQTGTTYTLVSGDSGKIIDHANGSAITVTLPNSLPVGFCCTYVQSGAGQVTFSAASGATLRNRQSQTKIAGQWGEAVLHVRANSGGAAAEYVLGGDTSA